MRVKTVLFSLTLIVISFFVSLQMMDWISPTSRNGTPAIVKLSPLPPPTNSTKIIAPFTIPLDTIRATADRIAPRNFSGKADNPVGQFLQNADISWTIERGAMTAAGASNQLTLTTPLDGKLNVTGSLSNNVGSALSSLIGGDIGKQIGNVSIKALNANADIHGSIAITSRPQLTEQWHIEPNINAQVSINDNSVTAGGVRIGVPTQVKPLIDKLVNEQVAAIQQRIRNDTSIEDGVRREWVKMCRSIPLPRATSDTPNLFLEVRPIQALAAQPRVNATTVMQTMGVEAETRILPTQTTPSCPYPSRLQIISPADTGSLTIGVPIDLPFTEVSKIVNAQLKGRTLPENGSGPIAVTVKSASVTASGDRFLISLAVDARETKSFFGLGTQATVHVWGRPVLDPIQQTLRLADIELALESQATFDWLGVAAQVAEPYLRDLLKANASIDLKPFAANAKEKSDAALGGFRENQNGVRVDIGIDDIRLTDIAFDNDTLRMVTAATGRASAKITSIPSR